MSPLHVYWSDASCYHFNSLTAALAIEFVAVQVPLSTIVLAIRFVYGHRYGFLLNESLQFSIYLTRIAAIIEFRGQSEETNPCLPHIEMIHASTSWKLNHNGSEVGHRSVAGAGRYAEHRVAELRKKWSNNMACCHPSSTDRVNTGRELTTKRCSGCAGI